MRATYTNCDVGDDDWYLRVQRLDIDRLRDVGVAHNATLYFKDVPILYTPWMDFPLTSRRKTGFLPPTFGTSNNSGFEFVLPFYWNIEPNLDYTIAPRLMAERGVLLDNEFRYLEPDFSGRTAGRLSARRSRHGQQPLVRLLQHSQSLGTRADRWAEPAEGVRQHLLHGPVRQDRSHLADHSAARGLAHLRGRLVERVRPLAQQFQTLQNPLAPVFHALRALPAADAGGVPAERRGFDLAFFGEVVNFQQPTLLSGVRQIYYPSVSYP